MKKYKYSLLVNKYEKELINNLRDFNSEDEVLRLWVPDQDVNKSIINLLFSFNETNQSRISILIDEKKHLDSLNKTLIKKSFNKIAKVEFRHKDNSLIIIFEKLNNEYKEKIIISDLKIKKVKKKQKKIFTHKNLDNLYLSNLKKFFYKDYTKKFDKNNTSLISIEVENELIKLIFFINSKNYEVINCYFEPIKLLKVNHLIFYNILCDFFINVPIYEIKDHSIIRFENHIRPNTINKKVKGIVLPIFNSTLFSSTQKLVNDMFEKFILINPDTPTFNEYDYRVSENWKKLNHQNQKLSISKSIKSYESINGFKTGTIKFEKIEFDTRIIVSITDNKVDKQKHILDLEIYLRKSIDKRIELFYEEQMDKNKLRIKNSPQKI